MPLLDLPLELLEEVLTHCDPLEVASISQTCSSFRDLIYAAQGQHLWQTLFLAQHFDDPRICVDKHGRRIDMAKFDWCKELQRRIVARTFLARFDSTRGLNKTSEERVTILKSILDMLSCVPSASEISGDELSKNLAWGVALLRSPQGLLSLDRSYHGDFEPISEEAQLLARLHTYFGLTHEDKEKEKHTLSQAYVYDLRRYKWDNDFGPFLQLDDDAGTEPENRSVSGRVNWVHVRAIHHVVSSHILPPMPEDNPESQYTIFPMSLPYCQPIFPRDLDLDAERDWAGIEGYWQCSFCFCDHRQLLIYNNFNLFDTAARDPSTLGEEGFLEVFQYFQLRFRLISTTPSPICPTRPDLRFYGEMTRRRNGAGSGINMHGTVRMTEEGEVRWSFQSGESGNPLWSSEGIQIGNVRSAFGVLGSWTTVSHENHDPVGPVWLRKLDGDVEVEDEDESD